MGRHQGRITKDDIREAGFRRWDGRNKITTDWMNVFHEPELCLPNGDCLVYLREPGQSSRPPSFRVHTSKLHAKGFEYLLERCVLKPVLPPVSTHPQQDKGSYAASLKELYLPAPPHSDLDGTLDHHNTTRNFLAWLYDIPQAGRALGPSLIALSQRIEDYRPGESQRNRAEVISYAESQNYLDFRECVDHALAALTFAEYLHEEDLWVDAFAHCVGLSHRGLYESIEYDYVSDKSRALIGQERVDMDARLSQITESITSFFEVELSGAQWGLHQSARDHLDHFRSFLHSYYIELHGFWPPEKFEEEVVQRLVYNSMYADFRTLYHHLADPKSSNAEFESDISASGGVCVVQNLGSFNKRLAIEPLHQTLPQLPCESKVDIVRISSERRNSWNPLLKRRLEKEDRSKRRKQALVNSSNRDWELMRCRLVRRFSDFESRTATDELETVSLADGRKVRWIAVYAILQILICIMQAPKQVRNTEGLSYPLCCRAPEMMPWQHTSRRASAVEEKVGIQPDMAYSHTNTEPVPRPMLSRKSSALKDSPSKDHTASDEPVALRRSLTRTATSLRSKSLRRLITNKSETSLSTMSKKRRSSFCEIYVPGYGNGLNQVEIDFTASPIDDTVPRLPGSNSVSRESSNASNNSSYSSTSTESSGTARTPEISGSDISQAMAELGIAVAKPDSKHVEMAGAIQIVPAEEGMETVHFNASTWTDVLRGS